MGELQNAMIDQLDFNTVDWITTAATLAVVVASVYTDVRTGKIPNMITAPFMVLGLILAAIGNGWAGLGSSVLGIVLAVGLWFLCNILGRILGAADSKMLAAIGALQGHIFLLYTVAATALVGGLLGILVSLYRGYLRERLTNLVRELYMRVTHRVPMDIENSDSQAHLPYAVAIAAGTILAFYYVHFYSS